MDAHVAKKPILYPHGRPHSGHSAYVTVNDDVAFSFLWSRCLFNKMFFLFVFVLSSFFFQPR